MMMTRMMQETIVSHASHMKDIIVMRMAETRVTL